MKWTWGWRGWCGAGPRAASRRRPLQTAVFSVSISSCPVLSWPRPPPLVPGSVLVLRSQSTQGAGPGPSRGSSRIRGVAAPPGSQWGPGWFLAVFLLHFSHPPCTLCSGPVVLVCLVFLYADRCTGSEVCHVGFMGAYRKDLRNGPESGQGRVWAARPSPEEGPGPLPWGRGVLPPHPAEPGREQRHLSWAPFCCLSPVSPPHPC